MGHNNVVSGYLKSTGIPRVDSWSMDPRVLGATTINLDIVSSCMVFSYLYLGSIDLF